MDWTALWFDVLLSLGATAVTAGIAYRKHSAHSLLSSAIAYPPEKGGPKAYDGDLVVVEGTVSPAPNAVMEKPVLCVANLMSTIRHSARYDPIFRTWSSESTEVLRVARTLPFYLAKPTSSYLASQAVVSLAPNIDLESAGLEFPIISSSFAPSPPPTLGQLALDVLQGERVLGYETTERALPVGTRLTAVGILDFGRKVVSLPGVLGGSVVPTEPNESSVPMLVEKDGLPFLLSTTPLPTLLSHLRTSALHWKFLTLVPALVTALLLSRRLYRLYLEHLARKAVRELRARRRNSRRDISHPDIPATTPLEEPSEDLCVVCLERKRDTVLLPCAHYYLCGTCAAKCERCPVCRGEVAEVVKTFG